MIISGYLFDSAEIARAVQAAAAHQSLLDPIIQAKLVAAVGTAAPIPSPAPGRCLTSSPA